VATIAGPWWWQALAQAILPWMAGSDRRPARAAAARTPAQTRAKGARAGGAAAIGLEGPVADCRGRPEVAEAMERQGELHVLQTDGGGTGGIGRAPERSRGRAARRSFGSRQGSRRPARSRKQALARPRERLRQVKAAAARRPLASPWSSSTVEQEMKGESARSRARICPRRRWRWPE
jgi:hypothetical protein